MGLRHALEFLDDLMENDMLTAEFINKYVMEAYNKLKFSPEEYEAMQDMFDKDIADYWERQMEGIEKQEDIPVPHCVGRMLGYFMKRSVARRQGYPDEEHETTPLECYRCIESIIGRRGMEELNVYENMRGETAAPLSRLHGWDTHDAGIGDDNHYEDHGYGNGVSRNNNRSDPFAEPLPGFGKYGGSYSGTM